MLKRKTHVTMRSFIVIQINTSHYNVKLIRLYHNLCIVIWQFDYVPLHAGVEAWQDSVVIKHSG